MKYQQPDFYKFNQDSIDLVNFVLEKLPSQEVSSCLDVFAGCGVIGIELSQNKKINKIGFVELQKELVSSLHKNIQTYSVNGAKVYEADFFSFSTQERYQLIVMNPPYFEEENFRKGPNDKRNTCRLIKTNQILKISSKIKELLEDDGHLALVIPKMSESWNQFVEKFEVVEQLQKKDIQLLIVKNKKSL